MSTSFHDFLLNAAANVAGHYIPLGLKYILFGWKWLVSRLEEARAKNCCLPCETADLYGFRPPQVKAAERWNPWIQSQMDESKLKR